MTDAQTFPLGELVSIYDQAKRSGISQPDRLKRAKETCSDPVELARAFNADVENFLSFDRQELSFHGKDPDRDRTKFAPRSKTRVVAQTLLTFGGDDEDYGSREPFLIADRPELGFRYVDREIVTARAPDATFRTAEGEERTSNNLPILDLLLSNSLDRTPIVAELKVGDDRDPFYALIQALAHAAMLATPNQLDRLRRQYVGAFADEATRLDVYLVLVGTATGSHWREFDTCTQSLSEGLLREDSFTRWVRRIEQVRLDVLGHSTR